MKKIIALEELALFLAAIYAFSLLPFAWWWFAVLLFAPDVSMVGYLVNPRIGAITYNFIHHKAIGLGCYLLGLHYDLPVLQLCGVILFAHSCFDRILGYGLKHMDSFHHTHLGMIGKRAE